MGSKINLNINDEWGPQVLPILEKWKQEEGGFSDKVCEAIVFKDTTTTERIVDAIMQYDARLKQARPITEKWELMARSMMERGRDVYKFLTDRAVLAGPHFTPMKAQAWIAKMKKIIQDEKQAKSTTTVTARYQ